jgi:Tannase and feruloyl esterase
MRAALLLFAALPLAGATCESLSSLSLPKTTISSAQAFAAGEFQGQSGPMKTLPAFCRVQGVIRPSEDSDIQFEVWLPAAKWNGKFRGIGNGGFAGSLATGEMAAAVTAGYAAAATDTGHRAGGTDASWALGHPEKITDFGWRAIHETADKGKAIVAAFYGEGPRKSYFNGCSNGGRQALMEAQRFPADYDGIVAGAPANYWTHLLTRAVWDVQALMNDPASYIPATKVPAIESAMLAACDANDGIIDGLIDNPAQCKFDPAALLCKQGDSDACLTQPQVGALVKILSGPKNSKGEVVYPGSAPGGATGTGGWGAWLTGMAPGKSLGYAFGTQFFKNMVHNDAAWDFHSFTVDGDMKLADEKMAKTMNATDADLKRFKDRGGKLILYHGWSDAAIPPQNAIDYYLSVVSKMGSKNVDQFVRLYMVPGMQHCGGGPGPNVFDMPSAMDRWVDQGAAPAAVIAKKDQRTRPLCPYPQTAKYTGKGSTDDAANFVCK